MLLFEGREIEVENPTLGVRFLSSTKGLLKFPTQGGSGTGLVLTVLNKDLFCCFSTSSLVLITASLLWVLGKMENTSFIHVSLNYLHLLSCHIVNGMFHETVWTLKAQSRPPVNNDSCHLALKKHTRVWGSSSNKPQLGEERKGIREKGRWPHSDTCCLWDTPASGKQFRDEETPHPTKPLASICFHHPCIQVSLMTSDKLSFWLWGVI